jgi:large repetitive protein
MRRLRRLRPGVATDLRAAVIRQSGRPATGRRRRYHSLHNVWLSVLTAVGLLTVPVAVAQADATWTGASTSSEWSAAANWSGTTPPTTSNTAVGTLSFPTLGTCGTCYTSHNGLSGISATTLVLNNTTKQYRISGNSLSVGNGGIVDSPGGGTGDLIQAPIALSGGAQTWTLGSATKGYNSLTFQSRITGSSAEAVTMSIPRGDVFIDTDMEAGPITAKGPGGLHIGGPPGTNHPGSLNGTNAQTVTVTGGTLVANPGSTTGPLTISAGTLLLGTAPKNDNTTELQVTGPATLGSSITTKTFIDDNGSIAGTDFSQLSATSNIRLGGKLVLGQGPSNGQCVTLNAGDVATLVTTTGTLSGTFSNAPEGTVLTMASSCQSTPPKLQIHYTSTSVTATVVGTPTITTTTSLATPNPSPSSTNQAVTLTATVTTAGTGTVAPSGTVAFSGKAGSISGCTAQPLTVSGSSGTATCTTSFPASASPESLTAAFNPAGGSGQVASTSSAQALTVKPAATTTDISASNTSPIAGTSVTYTSTVTPATTGPSKPAGTVAFLDGGSAISACTAQPLTAGSQSSTATCTVTYPAAGSHTVTAGYGADANFTGSTSQPTTVTVQPAPTFPTTSVLDTFSQPGPLSSNWKSPALQDAGTASVDVTTSGQTVSSGGTASALWIATPFNADQEAYLRVPVLPAAGHTFQVDTRVSSLTPSNVSMYFLQVTPSKQLWDLRRKLNGAGSTSMKTFTAPFAAGDSAGLQLTGSTITAWHESGTGSWTPVGSVTDTSITAGGYIGFTLGDTTVRGGAFGGGN